jgi:recombinational DNA repair protein RecR
MKGKYDVKFCSNCEQPASNDICQTCKILSIVKDISDNVDLKKEEKIQEKYTCS